MKPLFSMTLCLLSLFSFGQDDSTQSTQIVAYAMAEKIPLVEGCESQSVDQKQCFQQNLNDFVKSNFQYPESVRASGVEGRVYVQFVIELDGSISNINFVRGLMAPDSPEGQMAVKTIHEEVLRVVGQLKFQKPAQFEGVDVRCSFVLPVKIVL